MKNWFDSVFMIAVSFAILAYPRVVLSQSDTSSLLTLERIYEKHEFSARGFGPVKWSKRLGGYWTFESATEGKGRDLVRHDPASGTKTVIVPASSFIPKGSDTPIPVESFEFSSDESKLLIFTNSRRVWRQNTRGDYWVLDLNTRDLKKLGGDAEPSTLMFAKFSPDGKRVAYVRANNIYVQRLDDLNITVLTRDGSETRINGTADWVNEEELSIRDAFRWSPDGKQIAYWQFDTSDVSVFHMIDNTQGSYPKIISFAYPKVGEKNSAVRIGLVSADGGDTRFLSLPGDRREHYVPHVEWTPDSRQLVVQQFNRLQTENRVMLADPASGETRTIYTERDAAWLENDNPIRFVNQGRELLWLTEKSGWRHIIRIALNDGAVTNVTNGSFDVIEIEAFDDASGTVLYAASPDSAAQRYVYRVGLKGGQPERLSPPDEAGWHSLDVSHDMKWGIATYSNFNTPPVVRLVSLPAFKTERTLIDNEELLEKLKKLQLPKTEFLRIDAGDGVELDAWSMRPQTIEEGQKLPLLVHVYGEPYGQTVRDAWEGDRGLWHAMLVQKGCVVVSIDNRGTRVPRGRDFRRAVHRKIGIIAPQDQAAAVRALLKKWSFIDEKRIGIWGWSGGGSMSLNAIFRYPELYHTAVAIAPVANQLLYDTIYQERYMGLPNDNGENYREGSPLTHAHKLQGNLLVIHGTGDDNCHYQGTELLMNELIAHGKQFSVMPYPNRSHGVYEGKNTVPHLWTLITRYFEEHLLRNTTAPSTGNETKPAESREATDDSASNSAREVRDVVGWQLSIDRRLLADNRREATERAVQLLAGQLEEITRVVPQSAVGELKKVPLYFNPEYEGVTPRAEFHPDAGWLKSNGRDPAMVQAVEFTNIRIFEQECDRMPNFALHELAHAYHFRSLPRGFDNPQVKTAYEAAKATGKYDKVERRFGGDRPNTKEKSYAMTTAMEYFAESTEAYFSRNDFFPFNRQELESHDPAVVPLLGELWGVREPVSSSPATAP